MQIAIAHNKFKKGGGSESYILDLINGFNQNSVEVKFYATNFDKALSEYNIIEPIKIKASFVPKFLRAIYFSHKIKLEQNRTILLSMTQVESDIVICGGQHKGYLKALGKQPKLLERIKIWNEDKIYHKAKKIVAHSKLMKKELVELYGIPQDKIEVVYPPVDTAKFKTVSDEERQKLREKYGFSDNEVIYLFPSTGHKRKGFYFLKSYFENTNLPIRLVVAGSKVENSKNITYLGYRSDMADLYRAADFTVMASNYEPFGLVGIESILSGTPVVFSKNMACLEVLNGNGGFSFELNNNGDFDKAIKSSIESVKQKNARITNPMAVLKYNPELKSHIDILLSLIRTI